MSDTGKDVLLGALLWVLFTAAVSAHTDLGDRIDVLTHQIQHQPKSASLFLQRGRLFYLRGHYQDAFDDFQKAKKLQANPLEVSYLQGLALLKLGRLDAALSAFNQVLGQNPSNSMALMNRARVFRAKKEFAPAASDYRRALDLMPSPQPDDFLEVADNYIESSEQSVRLALSVLDAAITKLGMLVQLQARAIEIEMMTKHYSAALRRVDALLATLRHKAKWLVKKSEILLTMGKPCQAKRNFRLALASIAKLPAARRNVPAIQKLDIKIRAALNDPAQCQSEAQP